MPVAHAKDDGLCFFGRMVESTVVLGENDTAETRNDGREKRKCEKGRSSSSFPPFSFLQQPVTYPCRPAPKTGRADFCNAPTTGVVEVTASSHDGCAFCQASYVEASRRRFCNARQSALQKSSRRPARIADPEATTAPGQIRRLPQRDKTLRIAKPMRKVLWTKRFVQTPGDILCRISATGMVQRPW